MKKNLCFLLTVIMLFSCFSISAAANTYLPYEKTSSAEDVYDVVTTHWFGGYWW